MKNGLATGALIAAGLISLCARVWADALEMENPRGRFSLEVGGSSLGAFVAPSVSLSENLSIRTPFYLGAVSQDRDVNGNTVDATLRAQSADIVADYYVGDSGLRLSAGLSFGGYEIDGTVVNPIINNRTYSGDFQLNMRQSRKIAPVISVGYRQDLGNNWGLVTEVGARLSGFVLSTTGQENLNASDRADYEADLAEINRDLGDMNAIPFISVGFVFRF